MSQLHAKSAKAIKSQHEILLSNLRFLLSEQSINETELSRRTLIPQPTLHKIFASKTTDPRISTLHCLAQYFEVTVDELYVEHASRSKPVKQKKAR